MADKPWSIHMADLVERYEAIGDAIGRRYGADAAAYLGPLDGEQFGQLEAWMSARLDAWQTIIRGRALGVLTLVYEWTVCRQAGAGGSGGQLDDALHAAGIRAQWEFLRLAARAQAKDDMFSIADVRARWFELTRQPVAALKDEARRYARVVRGEPRYGSIFYYVYDPLRLYVPRGARAAAVIVDDLEMWLLQVVLIRPGAANRSLQPQTR